MKNTIYISIPLSFKIIMILIIDWLNYTIFRASDIYCYLILSWQKIVLVFNIRWSAKLIELFYFRYFAIKLHLEWMNIEWEVVMGNKSKSPSNFNNVFERSTFITLGILHREINQFTYDFVDVYTLVIPKLILNISLEFRKIYPRYIVWLTISWTNNQNAF